MSKTTICKDCGNETPPRRFATYRTRKGELRRRAVCKDCRAKYQVENRERMKEYRRKYNKRTKTKRSQDQATRRQIAKDYINTVKDIPCTDCGQKWPPVAMDFDHVRGNKVKSIANFVSGAYKLDLIKEEIDKCEIVCACCHRIRTHAREDNKHTESISRRDPYRWILDEIDSYPSKTFQAADFQKKKQSNGKNKLWCNHALICLYHQGRVNKIGRGKYQSKFQRSG